MLRGYRSAERVALIIGDGGDAHKAKLTDAFGAKIGFKLRRTEYPSIALQVALLAARTFR